MTGLDDPRNRARFAQHAAIEAIRAELDQAYAAEKRAQQRIRWLTELLVERAARINAKEGTS